MPGIHFIPECLSGVIKTTEGAYHKGGEEVYYNSEDPSRKLHIGRYTFTQQQEALRAKAEGSGRRAQHQGT